MFGLTFQTISDENFDQYLNAHSQGFELQILNPKPSLGLFVFKFRTLALISNPWYT